MLTSKEQAMWGIHGGHTRPEWQVGVIKSEPAQGLVRNALIFVGTVLPDGRSPSSSLV
jgi:hypothetical protein